MAEELRFDATLIDAMSAPLNAIAEALVKVADSMNAATQVFQNGFDASVKASEALQTSMETLGKQVDAAAQNFSDAGKIISDEMVPALEELSTNTASAEGTMTGLSTTLKDTQVSIEDNTFSIENLMGQQQQLTIQTNAAATNMGVLAGQMVDSTAATDALTFSNESLQRVQSSLVGETNALVGETFNLTTKMIDNTDATRLDTDAVSQLTPKIIDLTTVTATAASNVGDLAVATADQTKATVDSTAALGINTDATKLNTDAIIAQTASTGTATSVTNNYVNAQRSVAQATKDSNDAGTAGEEGRKQGYGAILGATMLLGMAGAAARVGIDLVKMGMDGETALTHVAAMTGASANEMTYYKGQIEQLAPVAGKTISDLSGGLYDVVSVGYQGAGALNVLKASAYAAAAGGTDLHTVTNGLTGIMRAFSMSADEAYHATDILIKGVQLGKAPFDQFSKAIGLVGLVSHESGFKIEETTAALSTLTQVYPSVRQAGQNLQNLIQAVGINYTDVEKRVKATGKAFDDNKFEAEGLQGRLQMLWEVAGHNGAEFKKLLGNVTAAKAGFDLVGGGAQQFTDNLNSMAHASDGAGVTMEAFQEHTQTMQAHLEQMKGALSVVALHFAALAAPIITAGLTLITTLFTHLATFIEGHAQVATAIIIGLAGAIGGLLVGAIAALDAALGPMLVEAFEIAQPFLIAGIVIAALAVAFKKAYDSSPELRDALNQLWGAVKELGGALATALVPIMHEVTKLIGGLGSGLGQLFGHTQRVTTVFYGMEDVTKKVNGHLVTIHTHVAQVGTTLEHVRGPLSFVVDGIKKFADYIHELAGKVSAFLHPLTETSSKITEVEGHFRRVHGIMIDVGGTLQTVTNKVDAHQRIMHVLGEALQHVKDFLGPISVAFGFLGTVIGGLAFLHSTAFIGIMFKMVAEFRNLTGFITLVGNNFHWLGAIISLIAHSTQGWSGILNILGTILRGGVVPMLQAFAGTLVSILAPLLIVISIIAALAAVVVSVVWSFQHWYKESAAFRNLVAAVIDQLKGIGQIIASNVKPVIDQLSTTFKENLVPAWKAMQDGFNQAKPIMQVIAAIVGGILLVALALLIGVIKGVAQGIGTLLVGAIKFVGGLIEVFAGFFQFWSALFGGILHILNDVLTGHLDKIPGHVQQAFNSMATGVMNILKGLGTAILGLLQGLLGGIWGVLSGLVTGFIGFFYHIYEKLVGHSIIPDMVLGIVMWIAKLPIMIPIELLKVVGHFLGIFGDLLNKGTKAAGDLVHGIVGHLGGLVTGGVPHLAKFAVDGLKHLGNLEIQGIQHGIRLAGNVVTSVGNMEVNGLKHVGTLATQGLAIFNNLADQMSGKAQLMKDKVVLEHLGMKAQSLVHVAEMNVQEVQQLEHMRTKILDELAHTKDGAKRHALEMQLGVVDQSIKMHQSAAQHAMQQRAEVIQHMQQMKLQAQQHAHEMQNNVVSQAIIMGQNFVNGVAGMVTNTLTKIGNMKDQVLKTIQGINLFSSGQHVIQSLIDGFNSMMGNLTNMLSNFAKKIGDFLHFGSPTREGEGRTVMEWMPNLVNQLTEDLERGENKVGTSASKLGASIRKQLVEATNGSSLGGVNTGGGTGGLVGTGVGQNGKQEVHLHLEGGLGAGLQLLDPASRRRFARQIAEELGRGVGMQGRLDNGYSGF